VVSLTMLAFIAACSTANPPPRPTAQKMMPVPERLQKQAARSAALLQPLAQVQPRVAAEEKLPFESKIFSLSARSAPLQDVLMGLTKEAGLNLVLEKGVNPLEPVTVEISNLSLRKALDLVFTAYSYFYVIEGNVLRVKALETRFFRFEFPVFYNTASSSLGGNVLGGSGGGGAGGGSSGSGGGGSSSGSLTGSFSITSESKSEQVDVWAQLKDALSPGEGAGAGAKGGLLSEAGRAQINPLTGTIIVTDRRENLDLVEEYLHRLELSLRRQVVIEARIIEVSLNEDHQFGIDWSYVTSARHTTAAIAQTLTTGAAALTLNVTGTDGKVFLEALATQGVVNVISSPRINVMHGQSAVLNVGQTIPYQQWMVVPATTTTASFAVPSIAFAQAGLSLGVTPEISDDGTVTLHIVPIVTDQVGVKSFVFDGNPFDVPIINVRGSDSIIQVPDGSTVIMAGLIQESSRDNVTGIPFLKDIPVLGVLFSYQTKSKAKTELVITLTPTIVKP